MASLQRIIWLASFPKSGNTWTRVFLANYFMPPGQAPDINSLYRFTTADVRQDFFDRANGRPFVARDVAHWLEMRPKVLRAIAASKPGHHFVKTHCQVRRMGGHDLITPEVTAAAIYVMRNPFDLVLSYARHLGEDVDRTIDRMANRQAMNGGETGIFEVIGRWDDHIASWVNAPGLPRHVMRYEDMVADAERAFRGLFAFLRTPIQDGQLRRAIRIASFESLQKQEREKGFRERPPAMSQFFATGRAGGWRTRLAPAQVARIRAEFLPALERHYPEMLEETAEAAAGA
jgi:hypothetical protein